MGICFHKGPVFEERGPLRERKNLFYWGNFYEEFGRYVKDSCSNGQLSL
jgi:hypothetical protein